MGFLFVISPAIATSMSDVILYDYWRSSAAYRVRIALNLKNIIYQSKVVDIAAGDQKSADYISKNPQSFVPMLSIDGHNFTQSMAIIEYLDTRDGAHTFYPTDIIKRAHSLAQAMIIACDIHPLNNLRILKYLRGALQQDDQGVADWYHKWIIEGFQALEETAPESGFFGGANPNIVDICLVPQVYNARRFNTALEEFPKLVALDARCNGLDAFQKAIPENVKS